MGVDKPEGFPGGSGDKESARKAGRPLEKGMATHSSILAWRVPSTEETTRLQFMGLQRLGHH